MKYALLLLALPVLALGARAIDDDDARGDAADHKAVHQAVDDYVTAIYEAKPELIERSVDEGLAKFGFHRSKSNGEFKKFPMTFEQLVELSKGYKDSGYLSADPPKEIHIMEVLEKVAVVKLVADWGVDYMHLAKEEGTWKIAHVIWQSHPE
jgi:hypothetical protein